MSDLFDKIMKEATQAANEAGDKWVAEHTKPTIAIYNADLFGNPVGKCVGQLLDVCGFAHVSIKDKRTSFAKYIKKIQDGYDGFVSVHHKYRGRQEWGLNEECARAALKVFNSYGIKGLNLYSRID